MDDLAAINALGVSLPSPAYLAAALCFGLIGFVAYRYGKRRERPNTKWIGVALMFYPYLVPQTGLMIVVGLALCAGLYFVSQRGG